MSVTHLCIVAALSFVAAPSSVALQSAGARVVASSDASEDGLQRPDRAAYARLLSRIVDDNGLVDYAALLEDDAELAAYVDSLAIADVWKLADDERLAVLLNAYNAFTLRLISERYPDEPARVRGEVLESIMSIPEAERWKHERWELGGRTLSLDEIEHEIIRKEFEEPRIHWALVCAAVSCPPLRAEPYDQDDLDEQLHDQGVVFHEREDALVFDARRGVVRLTQLYNWFGEDFGETERDRVRFAARYNEGLRRALERGVNPRVEFLEYDWSLNDRPRKQPDK